MSYCDYMLDNERGGELILRSSQPHSGGFGCTVHLTVGDGLMGKCAFVRLLGSWCAALIASMLGWGYCRGGALVSLCGKRSCFVLSLHSSGAPSLGLQRSVTSLRAFQLDGWSDAVSFVYYFGGRKKLSKARERGCCIFVWWLFPRSLLFSVSIEAAAHLSCSPLY